MSRNKDGEEIISHKYSYDNNGSQIEGFSNGTARTEEQLKNTAAHEFGHMLGLEEGWITTVTDQNGITYVKNEYDEKGRVIKQYDKNGNITGDNI